ncbi:TadE/TadG family type IV pilus assembly protein [Yoonia sp. R78084]|uniref:TadE/TadG family type IV pilus assembly protein n=1 Tax=Yoonia sp. R78084 TaxID=3093869 RepID=UPI0037DDCAD4
MKDLIQRFLKDDGGTASIEIVLVFPVFFGFFLMTYESGVYSSRQVMLEHGVDVTVRNVRIGRIDEFGLA